MVFTSTVVVYYRLSFYSIGLEQHKAESQVTPIIDTDGGHNKSDRAKPACKWLIDLAE